MRVIEHKAELRQVVNEWHCERGRVALVPTMGGLHSGHLALVERAHELATHVIVSIFVNPLQFDDSNDFAAYPRTIDADIDILQGLPVDIVYLPGAGELFPDPPETITRVLVPGLTEDLCGVYRPGHFEGVATIVTKLFNQVLPDIAVFGEKDYQQLQVIRRMVRDLDMPVEIVGVHTRRESDGLALSSRNSYLTKTERQTAPLLYQVLEHSREAIKGGNRDYAAICDMAKKELEDAGFKVDYIAVRNARDLKEPHRDDDPLVILSAAWLGKARLIDNILVR